MIQSSDPPPDDDQNRPPSRSSTTPPPKHSRSRSRSQSPNLRSSPPTDDVDLTDNIIMSKRKSAKPASASEQAQQITSAVGINTKKATVTPVAGKPSNKVSPLTAMQKKLNFIPKNQKGSLNTQFLATVPGVFKIAEVVLGFVAFVLAICADRNSTSSAWTEHITFESTIIAGVFLLGYVVFPYLTLDDERNQNGLNVLELVFYAVNTVAYFISVWLMVHLSASWRADGRGAAIMGAILNVALTVLFGIETFMKFKQWKGEQINQTPGGKNNYQNNATLSPDPETV